MPYIKRNTEGTIVAVSAESTGDTAEWIEASAPELKDFLLKLGDTDNGFARSDQELIRVIEDIINTLIDKNLILFTDLPEMAQQKLVSRRSLRKGGESLNLMLTEQSLQPIIKL